MKKHLPNSYDINHTKMIDMKPEQEKNGFKIEVATFADIVGKKVVDFPKKVLKRGDDQIFAMKDGKFVMEFCPDGDQGDNIDYFYSNNLDDLTK